MLLSSLGRSGDCSESETLGSDGKAHFPALMLPDHTDETKWRKYHSENERK